MIQQLINIGTGSGGVGTSTTSIEISFALSTTGDALNIQLFNANSPCVVQSLNLVMGNNTINTTSCPAMATAGAMLILPPTNNGEAMTLKGIAADTGIPISTVGATLLSLNTSPLTSFVINAAGAITNLQIAFF